MHTDAFLLAPKTILIVDDIAANIGILAARFEDEGWRVLVAQDGEEGLKRAALVQPDLILLDVLMPVLDGTETCRRLKANPATRDIPVIFMTALTDTVDKVRGLEAGAVDYVTKPFQIEEVMARVHTHLSLRMASLALARTLADLQATRDELARSERQAGLVCLVSGLAHELNTPVGNCLTTASAQRERTASMVDALGNGQGIKRTVFAEYLDGAAESEDLVIRNVRRISHLIERFKQVAATPCGNLRPGRFALRPLVEQCCASQRTRCLELGVRLVLQLPDIVLFSYAESVAQVLDIVIDNALQHGLGKGRGGQLSVHGTVSQGSLTLRVHDDGVGIAAEHLQRLFEPFFSVRMGGEGEGLGLTVAHNLVTLTLGGRIDIESKPGAGTTVTITLPGLAPATGKT